MTGWTHATLYEALAKAGLENATDRRGGPKKEPYVALYPQKPNCAVLYRPDSRAYAGAPLHVNESRGSWRRDLASQFSAVLLHDESDRDSNGFLRCRVAPGGWAVIARALQEAGVL